MSSTSGIEELLEMFLNGIDLDARCDSLVTSKFEEIAKGGSSDLIAAQHGLSVKNGVLHIKIDQTVLEKLKAASYSILGIEDKGNGVKVTLEVLFTT